MYLNFTETDWTMRVYDKENSCLSMINNIRFNGRFDGNDVIITNKSVAQSDITASGRAVRFTLGNGNIELSGTVGRYGCDLNIENTLLNLADQLTIDSIAINMPKESYI
jgi:hypothetical protein